MEDKIYTFHLYASCEDVRSEISFSYTVSINFEEIKVHTSTKSSYIKTPLEMEQIEYTLKEQEKTEQIRNLRFQNKVNVKIENGQYKIIRDDKLTT